MPDFGFPQFTGQASLGEAGVLAVSHLFLSELRWLFRRNHQEHDFGVDGHVDIVTAEGRVTGRGFAVQIKHGASYFREDTGDGYRFRGPLKHINYYANYPLPVVLVLSHPGTGECFWAVFDILQTSKAGEDWTLLVPKSQRLSVASREALEALAGTPKDYSNALEQYWRENELLTGEGLIIIGIARKDIEAFETDWFVATFERLQLTSGLAKATQGRVEFWVSGYDEDPRDLWEIPEVQHWFRAVDGRVKYWFYFCNTRTPHQALTVLLACCCDGKRLPDTSIDFAPALLKPWIEAHFIWLNEITDRLGLPVEDNKRMSFAALNALDPDFVPPEKP